MKIAVASGKGGTGKTTVATNLAYFLAQKGYEIGYWDCDVEEPNGHLFFNLAECYRKDVTVPVPHVNMEACDLCGKCGDFCEFGAITTVSNKVLTFPKLCHGCGGCKLVCPQDAILESSRKIGELIHSTYKKFPNLSMTYGFLTLNETLAVPIVKEVKCQSNKDDITIIDSPPGTSCPVVESVKGSDFVILVSEPTPFGLHDLELAVRMLNKLSLQFGVVINQVGIGDDRVHQFCNNNNIPILLEIPHSQTIAELHSRGTIFLTELPEFNQLFSNFFQSIMNHMK